MSANHFAATGDYRVGVVVLGKDASKDFKDDRAEFDARYKAGFRAFQMFLIGYTPAYLTDVRKWADDQNDGDVEISGLLAFIEPGKGGACPISPIRAKRVRAMDQFKKSLELSPIVRSTGLHGPFPQGLMNTHLEDDTPQEQDERLMHFVQGVDQEAAQAKHVVGWEVLNMHENPPPGPTTIARMRQILKGRSAWMRYLLDSCHQGQGEKSTVEAWESVKDLASCIHFSDYGRTRFGQEQALTPDIFRFLAAAKLPHTLYVEAVGNDVSSFIKQALHVNNLPNMTGLEVHLDAMEFVKRNFAAVA